MAEPSTIARPYAEAAYRLADAGGKLGEWSAAIANLAQVAADERVAQVMRDPNVPAEKVAGLFIGILSGKLAGDAENFVRVLAENHRLDVLAEIREQFEALKNSREGVVEVEIHTAFPLDAAQLADLTARIEQQTRRKVKTRVIEDKSLLGGVKVTIGDKVIDGSARAQLAALAATLKI
jgi:F-type H+-transporting ATPase subunit delta